MAERAPLRSGGGPYRLGIIGDPVAHSLSPAIHQPALDRLGIPAVYERWHTTSKDLAARFASLRRPNVLGANVTVPHKIAALRASDDVAAAAARAGAVNTIVNVDGRLFGDNTDIAGFSASMVDVMSGTVPSVAVVLGAGGAARAVVLALEGLGVGDVIVANRDVERARRLAEDLAPAPARPVALDGSVMQQWLPSVGLLVNATSLGWHPGEAPFDLQLLDRLPDDAIVADLTYRDTDLLVGAANRSLRTVDGLMMLVHQGARAFELFTGYPAPIETMLAAARRAREGA